MPVNFTELMININEKNEIDKQNKWNQIAPYIDVITKKALYEDEKKKLAAGYGEIAKAEGWEFNAAPDAQGRYASAEMLTAQFQSQRGVKTAQQKASEWYEANKMERPQGYDTMTPTQQSVYYERDQKNLATNQVIDAARAAYPEIERELPKDFDTMAPQSKAAVVERLVKEQNDDYQIALEIRRQKEINAAFPPSRGGGGGSGGSGGGSGGSGGDGGDSGKGDAVSIKVAKETRDNAMNAYLRYESGVMYNRSDGKKSTVVGKITPAQNGRFTASVTLQMPDSKDAKNLKKKWIRFNGTYWYAGGKKVDASEIPISVRDTLRVAHGNLTKDYRNYLAAKQRLKDMSPPGVIPEFLGLD